MTGISDAAADVIRTIACRNIIHVLEILEDSEYDFLAAGMTDHYDTLRRIDSALEQLMRDLTTEMREGGRE